jgi:lipoic acid synthetase
MHGPAREAAMSIKKLPILRKPEWLKVRAPGGERYAGIKSRVKTLGLATVCEEAQCPNIGECWGSGTATLMLLGDICTRGCRFCAVDTSKQGRPVDVEEPQKVASTVHEMGLDYVVLTMVDRDDLPDGGAAHVGKVIREIHRKNPETLVEMLAGDFLGREEDVYTVLQSAPEVFAHNIETVRRLTPTVRDPRCGYERTLGVLAAAKRLSPQTVTKSSIMLGLGETEEEVLDTMRDLRGVGVEIVTLGQYLRPSLKHLPIVEYVAPEQFARLQAQGEAMGFAYVASGPLVRSSYKASEFFVKSLVRRDKPETRPHAASSFEV